MELTFQQRFSYRKGKGMDGIIKKILNKIITRFFNKPTCSYVLVKKENENKRKTFHQKEILKRWK